MPKITAEFFTASVPVKKGTSPRFFINADGLGADAGLHIELLDHLERPLAGFSGRDAPIVRRSGFQILIAWAGTHVLPERVKIHVVFEGEKRTAIRLSAIYVQP